MLKWFFDSIISYVKAGMPCVFHLATGYYCPGCGGTRSVIALLHGHIIQSFIFHPIPLYVIAAMIFLFFNRRNMEKKLIPVCVLAIVIILANFIIKNVALYNGIDLLAQ